MLANKGVIHFLTFQGVYMVSQKIKKSFTMFLRLATFYKCELKEMFINNDALYIKFNNEK